MTYHCNAQVAVAQGCFCSSNRIHVLRDRTWVSPDIVQHEKRMIDVFLHWQVYKPRAS